MNGANTTRKDAISQGTMPGARTPGKFARSNARDAPGKMTWDPILIQPLANENNRWQNVKHNLPGVEPGTLRGAHLPGAKPLAGSFAMSRFAGDSAPSKRPVAKAFSILTGRLPLAKCNISCSATFIANEAVDEARKLKKDLMGRSPGKMLKALATGRLPGVLPGAESPANLLIANDPARGLAPGKCAPRKVPGSTPGKLCLHDCRLLQTVSASHQSFSKHVRDIARD
ncbi:hypothetical protein MTR_0179s0040 [Medicago truncatula]|uniref:Uncharacterized protein n=1 Tax=Medicago truncatula TaxID=3880 RepID=A0A072THM6_MEDTR|nr:hypothetical protein MTR_0179s0040 [Medicago truncatula]